MPESIANLRKENNDLKSKVSTSTEEISRPKDLIQEQSSSDAPSAQEISHSLEFLSNEYDDLIRFKTTASKVLQRLSLQLTEVKATEEVESAPCNSAPIILQITTNKNIQYLN